MSWAVCKRPVATTLALHARHSSSHHGEQHHADADVEQNRKEAFSGPFWRNTVLLSLLAVGFYKWAPAPGEDVPITRWLARHTTPREIWESRNSKHLELAQQASADTLLTADARRPLVRRYRYPQIFEQKSSHLVPVGGDPDLSGLVVKRDY